MSKGLCSTERVGRLVDAWHVFSAPSLVLHGRLHLLASVSVPPPSMMHSSGSTPPHAPSYAGAQCASASLRNLL